MADLVPTDQQLSFVTEYVANGGNATQAAIAAGYSQRSARQTAHNLLRLPHVAMAVHVETTRQIGRHGAAMLDVLVNLALDDTAPPAVRAKCASAVLDRGGFLPPKRKEAAIEIPADIRTMSRAELEEMVRTAKQKAALMLELAAETVEPGDDDEPPALPTVVLGAAGVGADDAEQRSD